MVHGFVTVGPDFVAAELGGDFLSDHMLFDLLRRHGRFELLPGGWIAYTKGSLPLERWKAPLYGLDPAPERPEPPLTMVLPQVDVATLFRQTWKRCVDGDVPGYADVAAVVGKKGTR